MTAIGWIVLLCWEEGFVADVSLCEYRTERLASVLRECQGYDWCFWGGRVSTTIYISREVFLLIDPSAFADYHVSDSRTSCLVPDSVSLTDAAPLACAGVTIYRAIIVSEAKKGDWLAMVGAGGGLGHLGIQMAKAQGIKVIAIDARDEALELCKKAGAEHVFDARKGKEEVVKQIQELTGGDGADATINLSEHETAAPLACAVTKMHGNMIQISQPAIVSIPFAELVFRDVRVKGSLVAGQDQSQAMLDLVGKAGIKVETNIFNGLNEVPKMIDLAHSGKMKGKAVCVVDKSQV